MRMKMMIAVCLALMTTDHPGTCAEPRRTEHVLKNLASGLPPDALPALRANHPTAAEMAAHPRAHPYLFFTARTRTALRARAREEPFRTLAARVKAKAEEAMRREIPPEPTLPDLPRLLPDGSRNPKWVYAEYDNSFFRQSYGLREVLPTLGFAYQLTGDERYAATGRRWLLNYIKRDQLTTPGREADFHMAQVMYALALGYDWLAETMTGPERVRVREKLTSLAGPMMRAGEARLARKDAQSVRSHLGGNHQRRTHGLFALVPLVLLYEVPSAQAWLDMEIQLQRDRLYPSGYAPDGSYPEEWDHYKSGFDDPIAFAVALRRMGGEDLFNDPALASRFQGMPRFFLYGLEARAAPRPWNKYGWSGSWDKPSRIYGWLALAQARKDPVAQWLAIHDGGLAKRDPVFCYLLYDPEVAAIPPTDPPGSVYFPYIGLVRMSSGWGPEGMVIPFRCGPTLPKDLGDQNGFRLEAGGEWLVPPLAQVGRAPEQPGYFDHDLMGWFMGTPAQNVVVADPDDIPDLATYMRTGRILVDGGVQFSTYGASRYMLTRSEARPAGAPGLPPPVFRQGEEQWLSGDDVPKTGDLRVVSFDPALDYVCGEASRSYYLFRPALVLRHILFVKGSVPYVLICDEVESDGQPRVFAWQLHTGAAPTVQDRSLSIRGQRASLAVHWLLPADGRVVVKQAPAPRPEERTTFVQYRTAGPESRIAYITALVPRIGNGRRAPEPTFRVVPAEGGWAVETTTAQGVDLAMFRSERASAVAATGRSTTGTAALFRRTSSGPSTAYILGE